MTTTADEPIDPRTATLIWLIVFFVASCLVCSQCSCTTSHPPARIALPSTVPVKRALAVATGHTTAAAASNAKVLVLARKAVAVGIPAGSQDAEDLAAGAQTTDGELTALRLANDALDNRVDTLTAQLLEEQSKIDTQTARLAYLEPKYEAAVKTIWWYRVRFWGPLTFALAAVAIYVLTRFTSWGARTFGPYILGVEKIAAKAAVLA